MSSQSANTREELRTGRRFDKPQLDDAPVEVAKPAVSAEQVPGAVVCVTSS